MKKTRRIEVTKSRYQHPGKTISRFSRRLEKKSGQILARDGSQVGIEFENVANQGGTATQPGPVLFDSTMTVDDVVPGQLVEEQLTRIGDAFKTSLNIDYFLGVWFDGLEADYFTHWLVSGTNYIVPREVLITGTEVIGRYVIV